MQTPRLFARLDKLGELVLCGADSCGCPLALVLSAGAKRLIFFGAFWAYLPPGLWRLSQGGRSGIEAVRDEQRQYPYMVGGDGRGATWREIIPPDFEDFLSTRRYRAKGRLPVLPAVAQCPICGRTQVLDPVRLDVVSGEAAAPRHAWVDHFPTEGEVSRYARLARAWINRVPQLTSPIRRAWYGLDNR